MANWVHQATSHGICTTVHGICTTVHGYHGAWVPRASVPRASVPRAIGRPRAIGPRKRPFGPRKRPFWTMEKAFLDHGNARFDPGFAHGKAHSGPWKSPNVYARSVPGFILVGMHGHGYTMPVHTMPLVHRPRAEQQHPLRKVSPGATLRIASGQQTQCPKITKFGGKITH